MFGLMKFCYAFHFRNSYTSQTWLEKTFKFIKRAIIYLLTFNYTGAICLSKNSSLKLNILVSIF